MSEPRHLLIVANRYLGDTVLLTPLLWALHKHWPRATLWVWAEPPTEAILSSLGPWCQILVAPRRKTPWWQAVLLCRQGLPPGITFDGAVVAKRSFSAAMIALGCGAKWRVGFTTQGSQWLLTRAVPYSIKGHEVTRLLALLAPLGIAPPDPAALRVSLPSRCPLLPPTPYIACHWRASNERKNWSDAAILGFTQQLIEQHPKVPIVWLGGPQDQPAYEALLVQLPETVRPRVVLKAGPEVTLQDTMALIAHAQLVVGVDSFALHLAAALGVPSIGLYGPTNEAQWAPWPWRVGPDGHVEQIRHTVLTVASASCPTRPCNLDKRCPCQGECMGISPQQVLAAVASYWPSSAGNFNG